MLRRLLVAGAAALAIVASPVQAGSLTVSPTLIERTAPDNTAAVTLQIGGKAPLNLQVRAFRWTQENGKEKLVPTRDVVASPPIIAAQPGRDYTIRIVRVTNSKVTGEESYRLLVDQLPDPQQRKAGRVSLTIRHSIPIFFTSEEAAGARIKWSARLAGKRLHVEAANSGARRIKLTDLKIADGKNTIRKIEGLAGYVLGDSRMAWDFAVSKADVTTGGSLDITASSEKGPIEGHAMVTSHP